MSVAPVRRWRVLVLGVLGCLTIAVGGFVTTSANAVSSTAPVRMVLTGITSGNTAPGVPGTAVPNVLVQAGGAFTVHVAFYDASGNPAAVNNNTTLVISSASGTLSPSTFKVSPAAASADLVTSLGTAVNQVTLTVKVKGGPADGLSATSSDGSAAFTFIDGSRIPDQRFDVLSELRPPKAVGTAGSAGIGGDDGACTNATQANPVCGVLMLPFGASSPVVLGLGACDATYAACGSNKGAVVEALADLGPGYTVTAPATLVVKCDKTLCGGGAISSTHLSFSLLGNGGLSLAPPCPAKNTLPTDASGNGVPCVDYVQSKRDNSGDTILYLLFDQDMRTSVG